MSLFPVSAAPESNNLVEFKAGKMTMDDNKLVTADERKGKIFLYVADDGLLHFCWQERANNVAQPEDDLIIFPGQCDFKKCKSAPEESRVAIFSFCDSDRKIFYWMQDPDSSQDQRLWNRVNAILNADDPKDAGDGMPEEPNGDAGQGGTGAGESTEDARDADANDATDGQGGDAMDTEEGGTGAGEGGAAPGGATDMSSAMRSMGIDWGQLGQQIGAMGQQGPRDISLMDVISADSMSSTLDDDTVLSRLVEHLPPSLSKTRGELLETYRSAQFSQAVGIVEYAIHTGDFGAVAAELGLDFQQIMTPTVDSFLTALQNKHATTST
eukprot:Clim_evm16s203 gene=Clim_evmTU16s203